MLSSSRAPLRRHAALLACALSVALVPLAPTRAAVEYTEDCSAQAATGQFLNYHTWNWNLDFNSGGDFTTTTGAGQNFYVKSLLSG